MRKFRSESEARDFVQDLRRKGPLRELPEPDDETPEILPDATDDPSNAVVYTDGSCLNNGRLGAQVGLDLFGWYADVHGIRLAGRHESSGMW